MPVYEQGTNVAVDTVARLNPLTNRPIVLWPKPVHILYSCKLKYYTIASRTAVTFVRRKVVTFSRQSTMS